MAAPKLTSTKTFELKPGKLIGVTALHQLLPDMETTLFFAKVYDLSPAKLGELLRLRWNTTVVHALTSGDHSTELQDYLIDVAEYFDIDYEPEDRDFSEPAPVGEVLPQLWEQAMLTVAESIKVVADKLVNTIDRLPSKQGSMMFQTMRTLNLRRPTVGDYRAVIHHAPVPDSLVVLDVSGSMTSTTIQEIIGDVVALSWEANAHLAIVSNNAFLWEPGSFDVPSVLAKAEYGGTHYESLVPLFQSRSWDTVITIADYDSASAAKRELAKCNGSIGKIYDISLVDRPTYLAECLGQLATEVHPLLVAAPTASLCW